MKIKVCIANPFPIVRYGMAQLLEKELDAEVAMATDSARETFAAVDENAFDLMIVSLSLNEGNGIQLIKDVRSKAPNLPILVVSLQEELIFAERVLRAGGSGYLMLREDLEKLTAAARTVLKGDLYLSEPMSKKLTAILSTAQRPYFKSRLPKPTLEKIKEFQRNQAMGTDKNLMRQNAGNPDNT